MSTSDNAHPKCFAIRRGDISGRADVNYWWMHSLVSRLYSYPKYSLTRLREVISLVQYGISERATETTVGLPILRMNNLQNDGLDLSDLKYLDITPEEAEAFCLERGDILFNRTNSKELVGKCEVFQESGLWVFASYLIRVRLQTDKALPQFVSAFLNTSAGRAQIDQVSRQIIGMSNVNAEELQDLLIPLPPLNIQTKLVAEMEVARRDRSKKLQQADELLGSLDGWLMRRLGLTSAPADQRTVFAVRSSDVSNSQRLNPDYFHPERLNTIRLIQSAGKNVYATRLADLAEFRRDICESASGHYYLGLAHIQSHTGELTQADDEAEGQSFFFKENDILFARLRPYLNKVYRAEGEGVCSTEFHVMRIDDSAKLLPDYLAVILRSRLILAQTSHMMTGNTHPRLTNDDVVNLIVPVPSFKVQQTIAAEVQRRREEARRLRQEAEEGWQNAKQRFEEQLLGEPESVPIAINGGKWQNKEREGSDDKERDKKGSAKSRRVAKKPRGYKLSEESVSEQNSGLGRNVHGVREGTGEYDPAERAPRRREDSTRPVDSTRYLETAQGPKTYSEVAEIIAVAVTETIESIVGQPPENIHVTPEWICKVHHEIAGTLFPDWAGHFRVVNVEVGTHSPPSFYEVPVLMRLYCDDLAARLAAVPREKDIEKIAETLAFADWRFQWIHPFKDFNGRVGRILLAAVLFSSKLPPAETASTEPEEKRRYLKALHVADAGDLSLLTEIWGERLLRVFEEKEEG